MTDPSYEEVGREVEKVDRQIRAEKLLEAIDHATEVVNRNKEAIIETSVAVAEAGSAYFHFVDVLVEAFAPVAITIAEEVKKHLKK